jgi:hypothetical protein
MAAAAAGISSAWLSGIRGARAQSGWIECPASPSPDVATRNFLVTVRADGHDCMIAFFPAEGSWTYSRTTYSQGGPQTGVWTIPASATRTARGGPLSGSFEFNPEGTRVGSLRHQLLHRRGSWIRVARNRFAPPRSDRRSRIYVQWKREGDRWVIDRIADEWYRAGSPLPNWCC